MNKNIELYKELLTLAEPIRSDYLKNVPTFENQLKFDTINETCYEEMYEKIPNKDSVIPTNLLYKKIAGLEEMCKSARKFFLSPRNKSIKGLDVQLGLQFENSFIEFLKSKKILAMRADSKNKKLPDIMVLDKTRNIKAYIELKYHNAPFVLAYKLLNREAYEGSITLDTDKLKKQLIEIESNLDRPVYFVHWVDFPDLKGIFFNTNEQLKDYLAKDPIHFIRGEREGDFKPTNYQISKKIGYTEKFYPPLHEMGDFSELLEHLGK